MIDGKSVSVLITTHPGRYASMGRVLAQWIGQPADEIWVIDGGGSFKTGIRDPRLLVFNMPRDLGTKMDYAMALLTEGDLVCLADDDVLVKPGFLQDLYDTWKLKGGIVGILGRTFHGPVYWGNTKFYRSSLLKAPQPVDFCGVVYFAGRDLFGFDVRGLPRNCDDLWWEMRVHPFVPKHVAATDRYENLPAAKDGTAMYKDPVLRKQREDFYRVYYLKNYANRSTPG